MVRYGWPEQARRIFHRRALVQLQPRRTRYLMGSNGWFARENRVNQLSRPLTYFLALTIFSALSGNAIAISSTKQTQHAERAEEKTGLPHHRIAGLKNLELSRISRPHGAKQYRLLLLRLICHSRQISPWSRTRSIWRARPRPAKATAVQKRHRRSGGPEN